MHDLIKTLPEHLQALYSERQATFPLPQANETRLWQRLRIEWNYHSNHIEGNTLTYGETLLLLIHGRTRGEHLLREYEEMKGHDVAIEWIKAIAREERPLSENDIRDLNRMVLKEGFWRVAETADGSQTRRWIEPDQYKTQPNHVLTQTGELFYFASPEETPAKMAELVDWLRHELDAPSLPLAALLAQLHQRFTLIHPFDDGNGRVVRLLLNYVLLRIGLLPLVIKTEDRSRYLNVIAQADAGDMKPFEAFLLEAMEWSLRLGIEAAKKPIELDSESLK